MHEIVRLGLLYSHLIAFAITLGTVVKADLHILIQGPRALDPETLKRTTRWVLPGLVMLLSTGLGIVMIDTGLQWDQLMARPKLLAKLCVVCVLCVNGIMMHRWVFPHLGRSWRHPRLVTALLCLSGSISASSWFYAGFLGIAQPLVGKLEWVGFMLVYVGLLGLAFMLSWLVLGSRLADFLREPGIAPKPAKTEELAMVYRHSTL